LDENYHEKMSSYPCVNDLNKSKKIKIL